MSETKSALRVVAIARTLSERVARLRFRSPVAHVYNPLDYAFAAHEEYLLRFTRAKVPAILLGMNPGPYGMMQTGVPFGEVAAARDFLRISKSVERPKREHPKRPILGFDCPRSEVSGRRLWGFVKDEFGTPEQFFKRFFVWNYCPLAFLSDSGKNLTPDKLPAEERAPLFFACDAALRDLVLTLGPKAVIGIGSFGEARARAALDGESLSFGSILHPSPASPAANRGWAQAVRGQLRNLQLLEPTA